MQAEKLLDNLEFSVGDFKTLQVVPCPCHRFSRSVSRPLLANDIERWSRSPVHSGENRVHGSLPSRGGLLKKSPGILISLRSDLDSVASESLGLVRVGLRWAKVPGLIEIRPD